jgi:hypothetical protein
MRHGTHAVKEAAVPLDVLSETELEGVLRVVTDQLPCFINAESSALGHECITLDVADPYPWKLLTDDFRHLVEGPRLAVREIENLISCL